MHADHALGTLHARGDPGDRNRGGVRRQDRLRPQRAGQVLEHLLLHRLALGHRFDRELCLRRLLRRRGAPEPGGRCLRLVRLELPLADRAVELPADPRQRLAHQLGVQIDQHHRKPALGGDLGDSGPHLPRSDDRQRLHQSVALPRKGPASVDPGRAESIAAARHFHARRPLLYARFVETRVFQGIVDDAAAICGALLAELRVRRDLLGEEGVELALAALGGTLAAGKARREQTAKRLRELADRASLPDGGDDKSLRLARVAAEVSETLEVGSKIAPVELWCADVPLLA